MKTMIPEGYRSLLSVYDTQMAIGLLHSWCRCGQC